MIIDKSGSAHSGLKRTSQLERPFIYGHVRPLSRIRRVHHHRKHYHVFCSTHHSRSDFNHWPCWINNCHISVGLNDLEYEIHIWDAQPMVCRNQKLWHVSGDYLKVCSTLAERLLTCIICFVTSSHWIWWRVREGVIIMLWKVTSKEHPEI